MADEKEAKEREEREKREREQREREERTREQQEQGQDPAGVRQQRVGLASGQANYVTPEEEDASEEAALERQEAVKEWAEEVMAMIDQGDRYQDLVAPLEGTPTEPERALQNALRKVFTTAEMAEARGLAAAIIHDDLMVHPQSTARSVQSFPTPNSGAAVSTDALPTRGTGRPVSQRGGQGRERGCRRNVSLRKRGLA
jgi:hypothetical protein